MLIEYRDEASGKVKRRLLDKNLVKQVVNLVDKGLVSGIGDPEPGQMCVEAVVAYAMGEKHNDHPKCVNGALCSFKIELNDADYPWDDKTDRAAGLRRLAIAQLGTSKGFSYKKFLKLLTARVQAAIDAKFNEQVDSLEDLSWRVFEATNSDEIDEIMADLEHHKNNLDEKPKFSEDDAGDSYLNQIRDYLFSGNINETYHWFCEQAVQVLIQMKTPGSKYLHMVPLKRKFKVP